jgi:acetyl-CoA C-acetyltransferase
MMLNIGILSGIRTPCIHHRAAAANQSVVNLAAQVFSSLYQPQYINQMTSCIMGHVLTAGTGQAAVRQALHQTKWPNNISTHSINKVCGSGMFSVMIASEYCQLHPNEIVMAGGMENMTYAMSIQLNTEPKSTHLLWDGVTNHIGQHTGSMLTLMDQYLIQNHWTRNALDVAAIQSIETTQRAQSRPHVKQQICPVHLAQDQIIVKDDTEHAIASKVSSLKSIRTEGILTAAHASGLANGAAAMLICASHDWPTPPLAWIRGSCTVSGDANTFFLKPIDAIKVLCNRIGWPVDSIDLFEINEAFICVPEIVIQALNLDPKRVNVDGGACVLGHPLGMTGARVIISLAHSLQAKQLKRGLATVCIGGGEATAIALENPLCP